MTFPRLQFLGVLVSALIVAACATSGVPPELQPMRQGTIEKITPTKILGSSHTGVGAVVGGVAGLGIGNLVGGGTGRDVAEVVAAMSGPVNLDDIQRKYEQPIDGQDIVVRIGNGVLLFVTQPVTRELSVGQRVYIEGVGEQARVIPR